jgi:hypothetical protein
VRDGRGERGQCWDDYSNRRPDDHERWATRLEPNAAMEPIGQACVIDNVGSVRHLAHDGASVRIDVIVPVTRIAMLVVRLGLFVVGGALFVTLRVHMRWVETGNKEDGKQEARHSHGSSPLPGDMDRIRARPLVIRTKITRSAQWR